MGNKTEYETLTLDNGIRCMLRRLSEGAFSGSYFVPRQSNQNEGAQPLLTMSYTVGSLSFTKSAS